MLVANVLSVEELRKHGLGGQYIKGEEDMEPGLETDSLVDTA